jgi:hypothetical protein
MNAADNQHLSFFFNFTPCFRAQPAFTGWNFTRFQRAAQGAGQSAGSRSDNIIQGGGMRLVDLRVDTVVFRNLGMYAKKHGRILLGEIRTSQGAFYPFDSNLGCINNCFAHRTSFLIFYHESTKEWKHEKIPKDKISCFFNFVFS